MKNVRQASLLIVALTVIGCSSDTSRPPTSEADALNAAATPEAKQQIQNSIKEADIERKVRESHRLPNGDPIPGYDPTKDHNK